MTDSNAPVIDAPLGTKRHVGRTGPRVDPRNALSTLIRFSRESLAMSRPELSRALKAVDGVGISVASIHTLEHERAPRTGELELLLPWLKAAIGDDKWVEFGGTEFIEIAPQKATRSRKAKVVNAA